MSTGETGVVLQTLVVLDSSIWRSQHLLRSHLGEALVHHLRTSESHRLCLPEVVEEETNALARSEARLALEKIRDARRHLYDFSGHQLPDVLPEIDDVEQGGQHRFSELNDILLRDPLTLTQTKNAILKVIAKLPPTHGDYEEFRDHLVWESAMGLLEGANIHFVTGDKYFFKGQSPDYGLADELQDDTLGHVGYLRAYSTLKECLDALNAAVPPADQRELLGVLEQHVRPCAQLLTSSKRFEIKRRTSGRVFSYPTDGSVSAIHFSLQYTCASTDEDWVLQVFHITPTVTLDGSGSLEEESREIQDVLVECLTFRWAQTNFGEYFVRYNYRDDGTFSIKAFAWYTAGMPSIMEAFEQKYGAMLTEPPRQSWSGSRGGIDLSGRVTTQSQWRALCEEVLGWNTIELDIWGPCMW